MATLAASEANPRLWVVGDLNGFFGLFTERNAVLRKVRDAEPRHEASRRFSGRAHEGERAVHETDALPHAEQPHPRSSFLGAPHVEAASIVHHLERRRRRSAPQPQLDAPRMGMSHGVAQRLLRDAVQH